MSNLKITHWNAGNKHWKNKRTEIQQIIINRKPEILLISEANIYAENTDCEICIPEYKLIHSNSMDVWGYTRMVALVRDRIQVEIQGKWMTPDVASVWLKISKKGNKIFLSAGFTESIDC